MNVEFGATPLGTPVRLLENVVGNIRSHRAGETGVLLRWSGSACVEIKWDDGRKDSYGYYTRRFEIMGGPW